MRTNSIKKIDKLLSEVFGPDYLLFVKKQEQDKEQSLKNTKIILIEDIMKARKLLGREPDAKFFDCLYDQDIDQLYQLQVEYCDMAYIYTQKHSAK